MTQSLCNSKEGMWPYNRRRHYNQQVRHAWRKLSTGAVYGSSNAAKHTKDEPLTILRPAQMEKRSPADRDMVSFGGIARNVLSYRPLPGIVKRAL